MADIKGLPAGATAVPVASLQVKGLPPGASIEPISPDSSLSVDDSIGKNRLAPPVDVPHASIGPAETGVVAGIDRVRHRVQDALRGGGRPDAAVDVLGGAALGPLNVLHGAARTPEHPLQGVNEMVRGAGQTVALPLAVANPGAMAFAAPPIIVQHAVQTGLTKAGADPDFSEFAGNLAGVGTGLRVQTALKPPPLAKVTSPTQESAFNAIHPENAVTDESVLPTVRNAAAQQGVKAVPKGKAGVELPQQVLQKSIDAHEARVQAVKTPYESYTHDNSAAANAARSKITSEMRNAALKNPKIQSQINEIEDIAQRAEGANTIELADQLRHTWNDDLNSELSKTQARQDVSPAATQAKRVAARALRKSLYEKLSDLSGEDIRPLAQREGQLLEAKAGVTKTGQMALKSRQNDLGEHPRIQAVANAAKKINLAKPASTLQFLPDAVRAVIDPQSQTPVGQYVSRVQRSLGKLGAAEPEPAPYAPAPPRALLPSGPTITPPPADTSGSVAYEPPPVASTSRLQRQGATPPNAAGTFEHSYANQRDAGVLPNSQGQVVPKLLGGAGPEGQKLLPESGGGSAIGLPEKSQSTLEGGRSYESPRAPLDSQLPALIRDFVEKRNPTRLPDTVTNSPAKAADFQNQAALKMFGKPYEQLSVPERIRTLSEGAKLQDAARAPKSDAQTFLDTLIGRDDSVIPEPVSHVTTPNGSGESAASQEALSRVASEKANGVKRVRIDTRSGAETPLFGPDAVDARPGPFDRIVQRDASGRETTLDSGQRARPEPRIFGTKDGKRVHIPKSQLKEAINEGFQPEGQ